MRYAQAYVNSFNRKDLYSLGKRSTDYTLDMYDNIEIPDYLLEDKEEEEISSIGEEGYYYD